jgi:hypothetical protein
MTRISASRCAFIAALACRLLAFQLSIALRRAIRPFSAFA